MRICKVRFQNYENINFLYPRLHKTMCILGSFYLL